MASIMLASKPSGGELPIGHEWNNTLQKSCIKGFLICKWCPPYDPYVGEWALVVMDSIRISSTFWPHSPPSLKPSMWRGLKTLSNMYPRHHDPMWCQPPTSIHDWSRMFSMGHAKGACKHYVTAEVHSSVHNMKHQVLPYYSHSPIKIHAVWSSVAYGSNPRSRLLQWA